MLAILTEHYGGKWPLWLSPRQVMVVPISARAEEYAQQVCVRVCVCVCVACVRQGPMWRAAALQGRSACKADELRPSVRGVLHPPHARKRAAAIRTAHPRALQVRRELRGARLHVDVDVSDRTMQKKVREAQLAQYNYILVVGEQEMVRARG
jgi:threonyl-tRNA synthetase